MGCSGSADEKKPEVAAEDPKEERKPDAAAAAKVPEGPSYFFINHEFAEASREAWWKGVTELMADQEKFGAAIAAHKAAGFYNHAFMAEGQDHAMCVWEAQAGKTQADMEAFINTGEASPAKAADGIKNTVFPIRCDLSGPSPWPSAFAEGFAAAPTTNEGGSVVFVIRHDFKEGQAEAWWKTVQELMANEAKMKEMEDATKAKGFYNSAFMATNEAGPAFCIWEGAKGKTKADLETFINSDELSPANDKVFTNTVMTMDAALNPMPPLSTILREEGGGDRSCGARSC
jgi:hypothetical protein